MENQEEKKGIFLEIKEDHIVEVTINGEMEVLLAIVASALSDKESKFRFLIDTAFKFLEEYGHEIE
jgi:hypothetical protein